MLHIDFEYYKNCIEADVVEYFLYLLMGSSMYNLCMFNAIMESEKKHINRSGRSCSLDWHQLHPLTKCVALKIFVESTKASVLAMVSSVKLFDTTRRGVAEDCATAQTGESSIMTVSTMWTYPLVHSAFGRTTLPLTSSLIETKLSL